MKILYITKSEKKVREFKEILKKHIDAIVTIDSLFDLEYDVLLNVPTRDMEANVKKIVSAIWKKEKENYDYVIADGYGLFSDYAPNILGVDSDTWWPGTQRDKNEALVNLFLVTSFISVFCLTSALSKNNVTSLSIFISIFSYISNPSIV